MLCSDPKGHVINLCVPLASLPFLSLSDCLLHLPPLCSLDHVHATHLLVKLQHYTLPECGLQDN